MTKKDIIAMHEGRLIDIKDDNEEMVDKLTEAIYSSLIGDFKTLEFEFIMEQLANLGHCPNLFNDDNGHWAITSSGFSSVSLEVADWEGSFFVAKEDWCDTPREALWHYLLKK